MKDKIERLLLELDELNKVIEAYNSSIWKSEYRWMNIVERQLRYLLDTVKFLLEIQIGDNDGKRS